MAKNEFSIGIPDKEMRKAIKQIKNYEDSSMKAFKGLVRRTTIRVARRAMQDVAVRFGHLRQAITWLVKDWGGEVTVEKDYGAAVEFGTKPHIIRPRRKKALAFVPGGGVKFWNEDERIVVGGVKHPGTDAQPYLEPAVDSESGPFLKALKKIFETGK